MNCGDCGISLPSRTEVLLGHLQERPWQRPDELRRLRNRLPGGPQVLPAGRVRQPADRQEPFPAACATAHAQLGWTAVRAASASIWRTTSTTVAPAPASVSPVITRYSARARRADYAAFCAAGTCTCPPGTYRCGGTDATSVLFSKQLPSLLRSNINPRLALLSEGVRPNHVQRLANSPRLALHTRLSCGAARLVPRVSNRDHNVWHGSGREFALGALLLAAERFGGRSQT